MTSINALLEKQRGLNRRARAIVGHTEPDPTVRRIVNALTTGSSQAQPSPLTDQRRAWIAENAGADGLARVEQYLIAHPDEIASVSATLDESQLMGKSGKSQTKGQVTVDSNELIAPLATEMGISEVFLGALIQQLGHDGAYNLLKTVYEQESKIDILTGEPYKNTFAGDAQTKGYKSAFWGQAVIQPDTTVRQSKARTDIDLFWRQALKEK